MAVYQDPSGAVCEAAVLLEYGAVVVADFAWGVFQDPMPAWAVPAAKVRTVAWTMRGGRVTSEEPVYGRQGSMATLKPDLRFSFRHCAFAFTLCSLHPRPCLATSHPLSQPILLACLLCSGLGPRNNFAALM